MITKKSIKGILKPAGYASIIGLVTFLSTIFCTNDSFSQWKENHYHPRNLSQDQSIAILKTELRFYRSTLVKIDGNLEKLLKRK